MIATVIRPQTRPPTTAAAIRKIGPQVETGAGLLGAPGPAGSPPTRTPSGRDRAAAPRPTRRRPAHCATSALDSPLATPALDGEPIGDQTDHDRRATNARIRSASVSSSTPDMEEGREDVVAAGERSGR